MNYSFINLANKNSRKYHTRLVCIIIISFYSIHIVNAYFRGGSSYTILLAIFWWTEPLVLALFAIYMRYLIEPNPSKNILLYLPYIALLAPVINSIYSFLPKYFDIINYAITSNFLLTASHIVVLFTIIRQVGDKVVRSFIDSCVDERDLERVRYVLHDSQPDTSRSESKTKDDTQTILEKVIQSILMRVSSSNRAVTFSLIIMVLMVIIGGGASFGTVALSEANKIRELEVERGNLLRLTHLLSHPDSIKDSNHYKEIKERISLKYGTQNSYKNLLENIEKQSYISWPDIAMRITIAALTLFLVQIFFHIYKYNQQQSSQLMNKAETLELFREADANQAELRTFLLSKSEFSTKFDKSPVSPTEQIINIIGKAKDSE